MPLRFQKLLVIVLVGLLGLSPVLASSAADVVSQQAKHCMEHKDDNCQHHQQGQCDHNGSCTMGHCFTQTMTTAPLVLHTTLVLATINLPVPDQIPSSIVPSSLYRPPQA